MPRINAPLIIFCLASEAFEHEFCCRQSQSSSGRRNFQENQSMFSFMFISFFSKSCFQGSISQLPALENKGWGQEENSTKGNMLHWSRLHFSSEKVFRKLLYQCIGTDGQDLYLLSLCLSVPAPARTNQEVCPVLNLCYLIQTNVPTPFPMLCSLPNTSLFSQANRLQRAEKQQKCRTGSRAFFHAQYELFHKYFSQNASNLFGQDVFSS